MDFNHHILKGLEKAVGSAQINHTDQTNHGKELHKLLSTILANQENILKQLQNK